MNNYKNTGIFFGMWVGSLLAASVVVELFLQGQVYSYRTFMIVAILSVSAIFSSTLSWWLFSKFGNSSHVTSLILCLANIILFIVIGSAVSYVVIEVFPELLEAAQEPGHNAIRSIFTGMVPGVLGTAFAFKTFGLLLLWPLGVISGLVGTFLFVHINSKINSSARH